jgi:hypothetical protein
MTFYRLNNEVFHRWKLLPILRSQLIKTNCTAICTHLRSFKPRQMRRRARRTQRQSAILRAWSSSIFFNFLPFGLAICNLKIIFRHSAARLRNFHLYSRVYGGERSAEKMSPPPILIDGAGESQRAVVCTGNFAGEERWMQTNYVDSHVYRERRT